MAALNLAALTGKLPDELEAAIGAERVQKWLIIVGRRKEWLSKKVSQDERISSEAKEYAYQFLAARYLRYLLLDE